MLPKGIIPLRVGLPLLGDPAGYPYNGRVHSEGVEILLVNYVHLYKKT